VAVIDRPTSIPGGVIVMAIVFMVFPQNIGQQRHSKAMYKLIDWPGVVLSLLGSVSFLLFLFATDTNNM